MILYFGLLILKQYREIFMGAQAPRVLPSDRTHPFSIDMHSFDTTHEWVLLAPMSQTVTAQLLYIFLLMY